MPIIPLNINDPSKNLFNEFVSQSFQRLLQVDSTGSVYDGTGSLYDLSSDSVFGVVTQPSHSFVVGNIVRPSGSANHYVLSQADIADNADVAGIVTSVLDASNFVLTTHGVVKSGVPNYPAGTNLFLSSEFPGQLDTESLGGRISKPLAIVTDPSNEMLFNNMRGMLLQTGSFTASYALTAGYALNAGSTNETVYQVSHSFYPGKVIRPSGSANHYILAKADTAENAEVAGMVTEIVDADTFKFTTHGIVTSGVPNIEVGAALFLSSTSAGDITSESLVGAVSKPLGLIVEPGVKMVFNNMRGMLLVSTSQNAVTASYSLLGGSGYGPYTDGFFTSWITGTPVADAMYEMSQLFLEIAPAMAGVLTSTNLSPNGLVTFSGRMAGGLNASDWYAGYSAYTLLSALTTQTSIILDTTGTGTANPTVFKAGKKSNLIAYTLIGGVSSSEAHGTASLSVASTVSLNAISGSSGSIRLNGVRAYNTIWAQASASMLDTFTITGSMKYVVSADNGAGATNTYQVWYVGTGTDFPNASISSASGSVSSVTYNYLSGISYYKTLTQQVNLTASNVFNPVYQDAYQSAFTSTYFTSQTAGKATPMASDIFSASFTATLLPNLNSARSTGSYTLTIYKPSKANVTQVLLIGEKAINSYTTTQATNNANTQNEYFLDEAYRSPDGMSAHFSSGSALTDGNLQVQNGILICGRYGNYASFVSGSTAASSVYANYYRDSVPGTSFRINGTFTFVRNSSAFAATNPVSKWGTGGKLEMAMVLSTDTSKVYDLGRQVGDNTGNIYGIVNGAPLTNTSTTYMVNWAYPISINTGNILTDYVMIFIRYRNTTSSDYISSFNVVYN